jgi:hypothetical protein
MIHFAACEVIALLLFTIFYLCILNPYPEAFLIVYYSL